MAIRGPATSAMTVTAVAATAAAAIAVVTAFLLPPKQLRNRLKGPQPDEKATQMDFEMYEGDDGFWDDAEDAPLRLVNSARVPYFRDVWGKEVLRMTSANESSPAASRSSSRFLDVGCGAGVATEELAKLGFDMTGIDPAEGAIRHARERAQRLGIEAHARYQTGSAFELPYPTNTFSGVVSSDVLEHLDDVTSALNEVYRVLEPGGVFVFDTINRTLYSWFTTILVAQQWLRYIPQDAHDWRLYITPIELRRALIAAGFELGPQDEWRGMGPTLYGPHSVLYRALFQGKGRASLFGPWQQSRWNMQASYLGWARKPCESVSRKSE